MRFSEFIQKKGDSFPFLVTLVDTKREDQPLVFANEFFRNFTGYANAEIIGRNCRFLQGDTKDEVAREIIRTAISQARPLVIDLLNFKKNGEKFFNRIVLCPVKEDRLFYLGLQHVISESEANKFPELTDSDILDRTMNPLTILVMSEFNDPRLFEENFTSQVERLRKFILTGQKRGP